jgi:hypothetical protein
MPMAFPDPNPLKLAAKTHTGKELDKLENGDKLSFSLGF